jgi:hypothetical protein
VAVASECEDFEAIKNQDPFLQKICSLLDTIDEAKNIHVIRAQEKLCKEDTDKLNSPLYDRLLECLFQEDQVSFKPMIHNPLVYAAFKGYSEVVVFLNQKFPEISETKIQGDYKGEFNPLVFVTIGNLAFLTACIFERHETIKVLRPSFSERVYQEIICICLRCGIYHDFFSAVMDPNSWDLSIIKLWYFNYVPYKLDFGQTQHPVSGQILFLCKMLKPDHPFRLERRKLLGFHHSISVEGLRLLWPEEKIDPTEHPIRYFARQRGNITEDIAAFILEKTGVVVAVGQHGTYGIFGGTGAAPPTDYVGIVGVTGPTGAAPPF